MSKPLTLIALSGLCAIAGCPPVKQPIAPSFRVYYPDAETPRGLVIAKDAPVQAKPAADCKAADGTDAPWVTTGARITTGALPAGLAIEDGTLTGAAITPGTYQVTIRFMGVTCGSEPTTDKLVHLTIVVE
jgi:hypothetical protein